MTESRTPTRFCPHERPAWFACSDCWREYFNEQYADYQAARDPEYRSRDHWLADFEKWLGTNPPVHSPKVY